MHELLSKNVFQFGECFVQPVAWDANFTVVSELPTGGHGWSRFGGMDKLTGEKITRDKAWERFEKFKGDSKIDTLLYHSQDDPKE